MPSLNKVKSFDLFSSERNTAKDSVAWVRLIRNIQLPDPNTRANFFLFPDHNLCAMVDALGTSVDTRIHNMRAFGCCAVVFIYLFISFSRFLSHLSGMAQKDPTEGWRKWERLNAQGGNLREVNATGKGEKRHIRSLNSECAMGAMVCMALGMKELIHRRATFPLPV